MTISSFLLLIVPILLLLLLLLFFLFLLNIISAIMHWRRLVTYLGGGVNQDIGEQNYYCARVVDLSNELDDSTISADRVTAFKKKLGKLGYYACHGR